MTKPYYMSYDLAVILTVNYPVLSCAILCFPVLPCATLPVLFSMTPHFA
jgi:hypothetical protein